MIESVKFIKDRVMLEILEKGLKVYVFLPSREHFEFTVSGKEDHRCSAS